MSKQLSFLILLIVGCTTVSVGQTFIEPCKYGQPLIIAIQQSYSPNQTLGYGPARDILYSQIDNVENDLFGVYSNFKVTLDPSADPSVSAFQGGSGINAEHVFPQSMGAGNEPMRSDMHNIYPTRVAVNSARGNLPFNDIVDTNTDEWYFEATATSSIPSTNIDDYSERDINIAFEPRESKKGDIARAVFYFYATYQNIANASFFNGQKDKLLEWHYADLPDSTELARSAAIAVRQGNENPFALDTSLAKRAFFMADASYSTNDANCYNIITPTQSVVPQGWITLQSNFIQQQVRLETTANQGNIMIYDINGRLVKQTVLLPQTTIDTTAFQSGIYWIRVVSEGRLTTFKIMVQR